MVVRSRLYGRRYPWEKWFRMREVTLSRYVDYNGMAHTFAQQIRQAARRLKVRVGISISRDGSTVKIRRKDPFPPELPEQGGNVG